MLDTKVLLVPDKPYSTLAEVCLGPFPTLPVWGTRDREDSKSHVSSEPYQGLRVSYWDELLWKISPGILLSMRNLEQRALATTRSP